MTSLPSLNVRFPAAELLSVASRALRVLDKKQQEEHDRLEALDQEDERAEMMECLNDTSIIYSALDPLAYYSEPSRVWGELQELLNFQH